MIFGKSNTQKTLEYNLKRLKKAYQITYLWLPTKKLELEFTIDRANDGKWLWLEYVVVFDGLLLSHLKSFKCMDLLKTTKLKSSQGSFNHNSKLKSPQGSFNHNSPDNFLILLENYQRGDYLNIQQIFNKIKLEGMLKKLDDTIEYINNELKEYKSVNN
jgi:hypothetical protein